MINIDLKDIVEAPSEWPEVFEYIEDLSELGKQISEIKSDYENIVVVGNGGSITSYDAYLGALGSKLKSYTIWTMDPDYIEDVKSKCDKAETIVVAVSKSGNTLGQIESLLAFSDYDVVVVTELGKGTLYEIAKELDWTIIPHPPVGGRFSGGTSSTFVSSKIAGMDIGKIQKGILSGYKTLKNEAYSLAKYYFDLEAKGYNEIYTSIYSTKLKDFQNLIIQLMHESACKDSKGQTLYASMGPESQHHTNQRFLGGKRNVIGTFIVADSENPLTINIPEKIKKLEYKGEPLASFDGLKYEFALEAEYIGTKNDADKNEVPNVTISLGKVDEESVGELTAFWHMVAYYSSIIREVNPFDQPAVENSKNITLDIIKDKF